MRLKTLELCGFKSFPDKTVISFNDGMTAIVGPNGSGKSNISDAVRWVLGETSSKSIRGAKMEDVIFGGTDKRRPMTFAEVTITLDNTDESSRMDIDYDEVSVTRRLSRTGDGEYFINRSPCRLKDINELFLNTGLGHSGYSIISQGRVADIISQKSDERRAIFEEAAGIAKYKYKKNEAERSLAAVSDNLSRVSDILSEIEGRLGPLESEAARARDYLALYEEKKRADISLAVYDITGIKNKLTASDAAFEASKNQLDICDEGLSSLDAQSERTFNSIQSSKLAYEQAVRRRHENDELRHELESGVLVAENDISHISAQISTAENDNSIKRASLEALSGKRQNFESRVSSLSDIIAKLDLDRAAAAAEMEAIKTDETENERLAAGKNTVKATLEGELADRRLTLSSLGGAHGADIERRDRLSADFDTLDASVAMLTKRIEQAKTTIAGYAEKLSDGENQMKQHSLARDEAAAQRDKLTERLNALRLDISSKNQRIDALRRMEELFEGYGQAVKAVMSASDSGSLSGICGPVSRIIEVPQKLTVAVETALGANIQNIVTEDEAAAKAAIALLKKRNSGRATFYPITTVKALPLNISEDDMKRYTGYVGIASALIGYEQKFAGIIGYMLGRTVVFDNLDNAGAMARAYGYRVRIVTLDGQLINAGGSFTGGSVRRDSGMLTRTADIARAMSDVERLRGEIAAQNALIAQKNADIKSAEDDAEEQKRRAGLINSLYTAENTQLEVMKNQLGGDQKRLGEVSAELDSLSDGLSDYEGRRAALAGECRELEMRLIALSDEISRLTASRSVLSDKAEDAARRENALDIELTRQSGELSASKNTLDFNISSQTALEDQISRGEALVYELNVKLIEIKNKIETDKRQASELSAAAETCEADKIRLSGEISALEARQNELKNQTRDMTRRRESVFSEYMRLQSERAGIGAEQDKITAKLWEDYELTYSACLALEHDALDDSTRPAAAARQNELRSRIRALGPVNVGALEEYKEVAARYEFLKNQHDDLVKSRDDFNDIIYKLENEMRLRFSDVMEEIDANFKIVFSELFGGGTAEVKLSDPSDVLGSGIDINVAPPGKIIRSMSLLSGGEQAFVAIALFFAILKVNPVPFCILDEIEAALDDVNVYRFAQYCRRGSDRTQFINITHRRGTMEAADVLYGVTMYEKGISKVITLNVAEVEEKTGIKL